MRHAMCQQIVQRCTTCYQPIGGAANAELTESVNLCGSERYAICRVSNVCQVVPEELRTAAYKAVWTEKRSDGKSTQGPQFKDEQGGVAAIDGGQTVTPEEWLRERLEFEEALVKFQEKRQQ